MQCTDVVSKNEAYIPLCTQRTLLEVMLVRMGSGGMEPTVHARLFKLFNDANYPNTSGFEHIANQQLHQNVS